MARQLVSAWVSLPASPSAIVVPARCRVAQLETTSRDCDQLMPDGEEALQARAGQLAAELASVEQDILEAEAKHELYKLLETRTRWDAGEAGLVGLVLTAADRGDSEPVCWQRFPREGRLGGIFVLPGNAVGSPPGVHTRLRCVPAWCRRDHAASEQRMRETRALQEGAADDFVTLTKQMHEMRAAREDAERELGGAVAMYDQVRGDWGKKLKDRRKEVRGHGGSSIVMAALTRNCPGSIGAAQHAQAQAGMWWLTDGAAGLKGPPAVPLCAHTLDTSRAMCGCAEQVRDLEKRKAEDEQRKQQQAFIAAEKAGIERDKSAKTKWVMHARGGVLGSQPQTASSDVSASAALQGPLCKGGHAQRAARSPSCP